MASPAAISAPDRASDRVKLRSPRKFGDRSRQWFWKVKTADLVSQCGGHPTPEQVDLIERIISYDWELRQRIAARDITFDQRTDAEKTLRRLRLELRELVLAARQAPVPTLAEHIAKRRAEAAV